MTSKLIVTLLVEVVAVRVKEITTRQYIEIVLVIFSWSVLNLLSSELSDSRNLFLLLLNLWSILLESLEFRVIQLLNLRSILLEPVGLLWRWRLCLVLELSVRKAILVNLVWIHFEQIVGNSEAVVVALV